MLVEPQIPPNTGTIGRLALATRCRLHLVGKLGFSLDEKALQRAGDATGERVWPLPLLDEHRNAMKSHIADLKNTGGRYAGGSTAAAFLAAFVGDVPWAHLDIAGTGWTSQVGPCQPKGGTGVGVRLVLEWLRTWNPKEV